MRRWRHSITTTIALTVVVAVVLGVSIQGMVSSGISYLGLARQQTVENSNPRLLRQLPGRIATLVDVLEAAPEDARPAIVAAAQRPFLQIRLLDRPMPNLVSESEPALVALRQRIAAVLAVPRPLVIAHIQSRPNPRTEANEARNRNRILIETALSNGGWLLFVSGMTLPSPVDRVAIAFSQTSFAAWLAAAILLGVLVSILVSRRLIAPLSELAAAVERLGATGDALPVPKRGPREVQAIIEAFNRLQERLRRFNEGRTRMIAAMSHDLRTPLTRLQLRLEIVSDPAERQKMLAELDTMGDMIGSVLAFARDDTRREPRMLVDISVLVEGVCEDAADAGPLVTFAGPRGIAVSCRPIALRRAISNLVDNAVKYGRSAAVQLQCESDWVVITIDDEGPGIPPSEREKVFEPFYRIEASRDPETGGVGLGLSVARSVIWEHGGDIRLESRRDRRGLHVRIELPAEQDPYDCIEPQSDPPR